jgi:CHAD domain-containing protein/uncharacterized protein YjbK
MTTEARPAQGAYEVELKYQVGDIAAGRRLLAANEMAGLAALGTVKTVRIADRYLDTPDGALARAGWACRTRAMDDGALVSLKGLARRDAGGALHRREELEGAADLSRQPAAWPASPARDVLTMLIGDQPLVELVTLRQVRYQRSYARDDVVVEVSADDVEVVVDDRVVDRFAELEAELRAGDEPALEPLVTWFDEHEALVAVEGSKLERALAAVRRLDTEAEPTVEPLAAEQSRAAASREPVAIPIDTPERTETAPRGAPTSATEAGGATAPRTEAHGGPEAAAGIRASEAPDTEAAEPTAAEPEPSVSEPAVPEQPAAPRILVPKSPGVLGDDHLAEAARKVLRFHLARMIAREQATRETSDPEELHAMRVATRRQRAAWRVFGDAFEPKRTARYRRRLRRVAAALGAVRDLDVLIDSAERYRARQSHAEAAALEPLIEEWQARRTTARVVLLRELDSEGYRRWLDGYLAFVQAEGQGVRAVGPTEPHRVRDSMPSRIWSAYESVRAYEAVMRWADVTTLHDLRIAAKWLRYTLEFVREALGRDVGPAIAKVVALQDHLGWLHDADVAAGLARGFLVEHAGDLTEHESAAIGRYLVDRERELGRLRRTVGQPWRGLSSLAYRRALGKLVAGL